MSCLWPAVFPKSLLFGDIRIEINKWRHQDIGGIHDFVTHDDVCKRHAAELLLGVRLYGLDLGLSYKEQTIKTMTTKSDHRKDII